MRLVNIDIVYSSHDREQREQSEILKSQMRQIKEREKEV